MKLGYLLRNRYRIEKALATDGFGETYLAIDQDYPGQPQVVVQHLKSQSNLPEELEAARRLFETTAMNPTKLGEKTDQIPTLYDYFEDRGEFYLVQEFLARKTRIHELGNRQLSVTSVSLPVSPQPVGRKMFLKWLGFGGIGVFIAQVLSLLDNNQTSDIALAGADSSLSISSRGSEQKPRVPVYKQIPKLLPKLTVVQFASVKLDINGQIMDRPKGSAALFTEKLGNGVGLTMVKIPAGKFVMGSPDSEQGRSRDEGPQHQVTIPEFYLGQTLVTTAQWQAIMGDNRSASKSDGKLPIDRVSWLDAMEFCNKLSARVDRSYRLPSEAEWEYACRAGTATPFAFGETITPTVVNYNSNYPYANAAKGEYRRQATAVGIFQPNGFGLYDMHGNLWEWCLDEWVNSHNGALTDGSARGDSKSRDGSKNRLLRGGAWDSIAVDCRAAYRYHVMASNRNNYIGLRVVIGSLNTPSRPIS